MLDKDNEAYFTDHYNNKAFDVNAQQIWFIFSSTNELCAIAGTYNIISLTIAAAI